jgi:hypothetical protein
MRHLMFMLGVLAATGLFAARADESTLLADLRAKIVGIWKHEHRQIGVQADTIKTYGADGSYSATSKIRMFGAKSEVNYEGKWEILSGPVLRLKVTKTNNRLYVPVGTVYLMKDLKIEGGVMTYTHDGKPNREVRQKTLTE